jgi:hypothetical protein
MFFFEDPDVLDLEVTEQNLRALADGMCDAFRNIGAVVLNMTRRGDA